MKGKHSKPLREEDLVRMTFDSIIRLPARHMVTSLSRRCTCSRTPAYGSWLNLVERWFAALTNKRIRRGVFRSVKELEGATREYIEIHNEDPTPFI